MKESKALYNAVVVVLILYFHDGPLPIRHNE